MMIFSVETSRKYITYIITPGHRVSLRGIERYFYYPKNLTKFEYLLMYSICIIQVLYPNKIGINYE